MAIYRSPSLASRIAVAANLLVRHPAYLFSVFASLYQRYESARLRILELKSVGPVLCMGEFYIYPDSADPNPGVSSSIILRNGLYEPECTGVFSQVLAKGNTVIDIGANIGWYTLLSAKVVGPNGWVISCEPESHNFELLERSVRLNAVDNVVLLNVCISDKNGRLALHISEKNAGGHTIMPTSGSLREAVVDSITVDALCDQLEVGTVDVIKIDAESAEPVILLGANRLLSRGQPRFIMMEFSPPAWRGYEGLLEDLFREFEVFEIRRRSSKLRRTSPSLLPRDGQTMLLLSRETGLAGGGAEGDFPANNIGGVVRSKPAIGDAPVMRREGAR